MMMIMKCARIRLGFVCVLFAILGVTAKDSSRERRPGQLNSEETSLLDITYSPSWLSNDESVELQKFRLVEPHNESSTTRPYNISTSSPTASLHLSTTSKSIRSLNKSELAPGRRIPHVYVTRLKSDQSTTDNGSNITEEEFQTPTSKVGEIPTSSRGTNVYIIGIVGVVPAAGVFLWCARWLMTRSRKQPKKSVTSSSESQGLEIVRGYHKAYLPQEITVIGQSGKGVDTSLDESGSKEQKRNSWKIRKLTPWEVPRHHLRLLHVLGEGNFGQVWKSEARHVCGLPGPIIVAIKAVKENSNAKDKEDLLKELKLMQQLGYHPNVVTLLGCCTLQEPHYVIMEYVAQGKLLSYLRDHRFRRKYYNFSQGIQLLSSRDLTMFAYHVATGMEYICSKGIIHRDLAARNVLVDHNNVCKVADFGLSRSIRETDCQVYEQKTKGPLPIRWMAPESLYMNMFTTKSDVWAFGILLWEIVTLGSTPYPGMGAREVIKFVREGYVMEKPDHCRPELYRVMRTCWLADPNERLNFSEMRMELARLLEFQTGYVDLEHFPEHCYYNLYQSPGEKV